MNRSELKEFVKILWDKVKLPIKLTGITIIMFIWLPLIVNFFPKYYNQSTSEKISGDILIGMASLMISFCLMMLYYEVIEPAITKAKEQVKIKVAEQKKIERKEAQRKSEHVSTTPRVNVQGGSSNLNGMFDREQTTVSVNGEPIGTLRAIEINGHIHNVVGGSEVMMDSSFVNDLFIEPMNINRNLIRGAMDANREETDRPITLDESYSDTLIEEKRLFERGPKEKKEVEETKSTIETRRSRLDEVE